MNWDVGDISFDVNVGCTHLQVCLMLSIVPNWHIDNSSDWGEDLKKEWSNFEYFH